MAYQALTGKKSVCCASSSISGLHTELYFPEMINLVKMSLTPGQVLLCTYHLKSDADILTMCLETLEL